MDQFGEALWLSGELETHDLSSSPIKMAGKIGWPRQKEHPTMEQVIRINHCYILFIFI